MNNQSQKPSQPQGSNLPQNEKKSVGNVTGSIGSVSNAPNSSSTIKSRLHVNGNTSVVQTKKIMTPSVKGSFPGLNSNLNSNLMKNKTGNSNISIVKFNSAFASTPVNNQPHSTHKFPIKSKENIRTSTSKSKSKSPGKTGSKTNNSIPEEFKPVTHQVPHQVTCPPSGSKTKRKFGEVLKEKENAKREVKATLAQISTLYSDFSPMERQNSSLSEEDFLKAFEAILAAREEQPKLINYDRLLPESLNSMGSCLLEDSKFAILYIKYKCLTHGIPSGVKTKLSLDEFLYLIDNFLMFDLNNLRLIYQFFIGYVNQHFSPPEILTRLEKNGVNDVSLSDLEEEKNEYLDRRRHLINLLANPQILEKYHNEDVKYYSEEVETADREKNDLPQKIFKFSQNAEKISEQVESNNIQVSSQSSKIGINDLSPVENVSNNININIEANHHVKVNPDPDEQQANSNFSALSRLSQDAMIYYNEMVMRNKVDLEIEKSHLSFNPPSNKKCFKSERFSIIKIEEDKSEKTEKTGKTDKKLNSSNIKEEVVDQPEKNKQQKKPKKSKVEFDLEKDLNKTVENQSDADAKEDSNAEKEESEERGRSKKKKNKSKNLSKGQGKKNYQSDLKTKKEDNDDDDEVGSSRSASSSPSPTHRKKTKTKRNKSVSVLSGSSAKESANEDEEKETNQKKRKPNANKGKSRSKSKKDRSQSGTNKRKAKK